MKTFEQFRRELADAVTVAINSGVVVGSAPETRCPLGVRTRSSRPNSYEAAEHWRIRSDDACNFYGGFDGWISGVKTSSKRSKFFALGRLYRDRFVEQRT